MLVVCSVFTLLLPLKNTIFRAKMEGGKGGGGGGGGLKEVKLGSFKGGLCLSLQMS